MTTWQSQYIPPGDELDPEGLPVHPLMDSEGWYVRTEWDEADRVRMVLGVHSEEEAMRVAEYLNRLEPISVPPLRARYDQCQWWFDLKQCAAYPLADSDYCAPHTSARIDALGLEGCRADAH